MPTNSTHNIFWSGVKRALVLLCAICVCIVAALMGTAARVPYFDAARVAAENKALAAKVQNAKLENQRLSKELAEANTPEGMERIARSQDFVRVGERQLVFAK